jgi:proteic killer suppression protein
LVEEQGIEEAREIPGYHDEPLRGEREGQRSVRLSRAYRAIYIEFQEEEEKKKKCLIL